MALINASAAIKAYELGNGQGLGYAPYTDEPGDDTVDEAIECAERDGWELVLSAESTSHVAVLRNGDGKLLAIGGDGKSNGAWAVDITALIEGG